MRRGAGSCGVTEAADRAAPVGSKPARGRYVAQSGLRVVGRGHPIADAALKVTGGIVYGIDMELPGMVHARLLLSPVAHARVAGIDAGKALALPGVIAVFSHLNAPATLTAATGSFPVRPCAPKTRPCSPRRRALSATVWRRSSPPTRGPPPTPLR